MGTVEKAESSTQALPEQRRVVPVSGWGWSLTRVSEQPARAIAAASIDGIGRVATLVRLLVRFMIHPEDSASAREFPKYPGGVGPGCGTTSELCQRATSPEQPGTRRWNS